MGEQYTNPDSAQVTISLRNLKVHFMELKVEGKDVPYQSLEPIITEIGKLVEFSEMQDRELHKARELLARVVRMENAGETLN